MQRLTSLCSSKREERKIAGTKLARTKPSTPHLIAASIQPPPPPTNKKRKKKPSVKNYDITEYRTKKKVFRFIPVREREKECVCERK